MEEYVVLRNRDTDINEAPGSGNAILYIKNGVPYVKGSTNAIEQGGQVVAQWTATAFALAIGATTVDFVSSFNDVPDLSFASHAFSLPAGTYRVEVSVNIDNTAQVSAGTYRKLELKQASTVVGFDIRAPLLTNMPARASAIVRLTDVTAMSVVFTHDAGHAIAGTFTCNFVKLV